MSDISSLKIKELGIKYCKSIPYDNEYGYCHLCPLQKKHFCINTLGFLVIDVHMIPYEDAIKDFNFLIEELKRMDEEMNQTKVVKK